MSDVEVTQASGPETGTDKPATVVSRDKPLVVDSHEPPQHVGERTRRPGRLLPFAPAGVVLVVVLAIVIASTVQRRESRLAEESATQTLAPPIGLRAEAGMFEVTLRWIHPSGGPEVTGYDIYRDGLLHAHLDGSVTTFVDEEALPAQHYEYGIEAVSGKLSSDPASIVTRTSKAPLRLARLEGTYDVRFKTNFSSGYDNYPLRGSYRLILEPPCEAGACLASRMRIQGNPNFMINLVRIPRGFPRLGGAYSGAWRGRFNTDCGGRRLTSFVAVVLRVVRAGGVDGQWVATNLVGTLNQEESPQRGCPLSRAQMSIRASRA